MEANNNSESIHIDANNNTTNNNNNQIIKIDYDYENDNKPVLNESFVLKINELKLKHALDKMTTCNGNYF
jgi:hypothetical protein